MYQLDSVVRQIPITKISENPANWELHGAFDPHGRDKWLVDDVREHGVLMPLIVLGDGALYDGHRRRRAAWFVGMQTVPVVVLDSAESAAAYKSAQLGRTMSVYAKCLLYRNDIEKAVEESRLQSVANLQNQGDRTPERSDANELWVELELILGKSRRVLAGGIKLLQTIEEMRAKGEYDKAARLENTFRDRGHSPAMRLLGEKETPLSDEVDPQDWQDGDDKETRNKRRAKQQARKQLAIAACEKETNRQESLKLLARLESSMKADGSYCPRAKRAFDELEFVITNKFDTVKKAA